MNLKKFPCGRSKRCALPADANYQSPPPPPSAPRRQRRLRYRFRLNRWNCLSCRMRDCRRRTNWRCSGRRPRHNCRRPTKGRSATTSDLRGGSADASSAGSKPAMCRRPQFRMRPSRSSSSPLAQNRRVALNCAPQKCPRSATIRRQMWRSRSLIVQGRCGTLAATEHFISILPMRKVTP